MPELSKLHVVITRPTAQGREWARSLEALGAHTSLLPVLQIEALTEPAQIQALKDRILALAEYQKVIFVSQNAVEHAAAWIDQYWPQLPAHLSFFAVGSATARVARDHGLRIQGPEVQGVEVQVPERQGPKVQAAGEAMNSEALLALPGLQSVEHEKVLICRGAGGRTYLAEQLRARGARVDYCELYQRRLPDQTAENLRRFLEEWPSQNGERTIVLTAHSGESLENLSQLIDRINSGDRAPKHESGDLRDWVLLVPGQRVAALAQSLGFHRIAVATNASDAAMAAALARIPT